MASVWCYGYIRFLCLKKRTEEHIFPYLEKMRKHGWQLPYHPLQVLAMAVFNALGFAFYVLFAPFVGKKLFQYVVMGLYTPLVICVFCFYVWCAATDPSDPGMFKSKQSSRKQIVPKQKYPTMELSSETKASKQPNSGVNSDASKSELHSRFGRGKLQGCNIPSMAVILDWLGWFPMDNWCCSHEQSFEQHKTDQEDMFYCSLCEVEVLKYSKHCRVCHKCVEGFDHHCRWINNCVGRKNYTRFFILMVSALLLLILQWSTGMLVLILCFLKRKEVSAEIISKLGSSLSLVPFVIVMASCSFLAMVATLPLTQLFLFHILLIKKGISTYDYVTALRERGQEQHDVGEQQSPQMSQVSSYTGLSSASSFNTFHHGAWCTPPRLFLEDQLDAVSPASGTSTDHMSKRMMAKEPFKTSSGAIKISPWKLAHLNPKEVSRAAAQARNKSKILQPIVRQEFPQWKNTVPADLPLEYCHAKISASSTDSNVSDLESDMSASLAPLQFEAVSAFRHSRQMASAQVVASPDSSLGSPDLQAFCTFTSGAEELQGPNPLPVLDSTVLPKRIYLSRSISDGYEASGGEDSDRIPSRILHRSSNWASIALGSEHGQRDDLNAASSASLKSYSRPV
ncbi:putative protein S-acyltransferase 22 [Canna indica]|uniref:S-acyltransferase n=1 Tax=Canna indica TaxID=4628 RepID=A0AAQ3K4A6_9LILI|nr:putative protein S-acyltransferase 22 [Canna indica]